MIASNYVINVFRVSYLKDARRRSKCIKVQPRPKQLGGVRVQDLLSNFLESMTSAGVSSATLRTFRLSGTFSMFTYVTFCLWPFLFCMVTETVFVFFCIFR